MCGLLCLVDVRPVTAQHGNQGSPLKGVDLNGRLCRLGESSETNGVVVVFLSVHCPISNSYLPSLNELDSRFRPMGVELYGVISDPSVSRVQALEHSKEYNVQFPVLFDVSGELRLALAPTHTPQAFVLSPFGTKLYSGAIDDRHVRLGIKKDQATRSYLQDAIQSVVMGHRIAVPQTKPIGCLLEDPPDNSSTGAVTFARDISPIIRANCASCHCPSGSGPFPLLTYDDVSSHANQILEVTQSRFMPPWKPAPGFTRFLGEMRLSRREISLLDAWTRGGKPAGDAADLPAAMQRTEGWPLGEPDLVLEMPEAFSVPVSGPDLRRYFVIPTQLSHDRLISAIDFHPGTPQAIHHASFFIDTKQIGRRMDQADPGPGYGGFGGPRFEADGTLSSWFPGMSPRRLPDGMGRLVPGGSDIVLEIHYVTTGKPHHDRSKIGLYFAPPSARKRVVEVQVGTTNIRIPPGATRHLQRATYTLPVDTTLFDIVPHMHVLGREMKVWSKEPDETTKPLLWIKDWDFNWQGQYSFAQPVRLPKGTKIYVDAWYDNSADNPLNPNSPPKTVHWGSDATDEMLLCHFQCTCETTEQLNELVEDQKQYIAAASR